MDQTKCIALPHVNSNSLIMINIKKKLFIKITLCVDNWTDFNFLKSLVLQLNEEIGHMEHYIK